MFILVVLSKHITRCVKNLILERNFYVIEAVDFSDATACSDRIPSSMRIFLE